MDELSASTTEIFAAALQHLSRARVFGVPSAGQALPALLMRLPNGDGLMYVVGFVAAQWILVRLARSGFLPVAPEKAPDLILYSVLGVMLGGRLGYALFYDTDHEMLNPLHFVQVWKGGLAFHGGLAGVAVAIVLFSWQRRVPWLRVADACALAAQSRTCCGSCRFESGASASTSVSGGSLVVLALGRGRRGSAARRG